MKALITAIVSALCLTSSAQVIVYNETSVTTRIGERMETKTTVRGFLFMDVQTTQMIAVSVNPSQKKFHISPIDYFKGDMIVGNNRAISIYTAFSPVFALHMEGVTAEGDVGGGNTALISKVLKGGGFSLIEGVHRHHSTVWALNLKATKARNLAGLDLEASATTLVDGLLAQGFTEVP